MREPGGKIELEWSIGKTIGEVNTILDCKIMCNAETKTNGRKLSETAMILDG